MWVCTCQISVGVVVASMAVFLAVREWTFARESKRWWARAIVVMIECGRIGYYGLVVWSALALLTYQYSSPYDDTCDAINHRGVFLPLLSLPLPTNLTSADSSQTFPQFTLELSALRSTNSMRSDFTSICQRAGCNSTNVTALGTFCFVAAICGS